MKQLFLKMSLLSMVVFAASCSKVESDSNWVSINKSNVEQCWGTNLANIRMDQSWFEYDDDYLELALQISDSSGRTISFENGELYDDEPYVDGDFVSFSDYELTDMVISVDARYQGSRGEAVVYCSPFEDGSMEIEIGRARFMSRL